MATSYNIWGDDEGDDCMDRIKALSKCLDENDETLLKFEKKTIARLIQRALDEYNKELEK